MLAPLHLFALRLTPRGLLVYFDYEELFVPGTFFHGNVIMNMRAQFVDKLQRRFGPMAVDYTASSPNKSLVMTLAAFVHFLTETLQDNTSNVDLAHIRHPQLFQFREQVAYLHYMFEIGRILDSHSFLIGAPQGIST